MKKPLLFILCVFLVAPVIKSQELIKGGNMEDPAAWNFYYNYFDAKDTMGIFEFNYTADKPAAGVGGCFHVSSYGQSATFLWQKVKLTPGHKYSLTGAFKNLEPDSTDATWVELILSRKKPLGPDTTISCEVQPVAGDYRYTLNTWMGIDTLDFDGTFQDDFPMDFGENPFVLPDTVTTTDWYVILKAGCWGTLGKDTLGFDLVFDEFSLVDLSLVNSGGNMEDPSAWNFYYNYFDAKDTIGIHEFNYTADGPAAGEGGCYHVTGYGQLATMTWQPVTITPGHMYEITGAFKNLEPDSTDATWVELILSRNKPLGPDTTISCEVQPVAGDFRYTLNTWMGIDTLDFDGTFQDGFSIDFGEQPFLIPDTVTTTEWYLILKAGCWGTLGKDTLGFDLAFDEFLVYDLGAPLWSVFDVANVVDGEFDSPEDYTVTLNMKWDVDSVYLVFDIVDDSINTNLNSDIYLNDNIEVYFDMLNTKIQNWPRNNGWPMPYTSGVDGNYQLRIVHDSAWSKYNGTLLPGTNLVHKLTADGYMITANIPWEELDSTFVPEAGAEFGFDILASDNDADPNYRNQVSWYSPTTSIWIDPAEWGTLKLLSNGTFDPIFDTEKPSTPANVAATVNGADVTVTWDASTDNAVVQNYFVYNGNKRIDTVLALQTGNKYTFTSLDPGDYTFGVIAVDVHGNTSGKGNASAVTVVSGIEDLTDSYISVYPNPSKGLFNIRSESNATVLLEVYTVTGGLVTSAEFTENHILDLSSYNRGIYFLHLKSEGKTFITKLIVQ